MTIKFAHETENFRGRDVLPHEFAGRFFEAYCRMEG
jgi:hypothetical protein